MRNDDNEIILIGGFAEMIELCESCKKEIVGIIDNSLAKQILGYPVLGADSDAKRIFSKYNGTPLIISPDEPYKRQKLAEYYLNIGFKFAQLISPHATISRKSRIGKGVLIQSGANISSMVYLEDFVRINVNANIMHDCTIREYTTVAPNAVILGRVHISQSCYIGANCTVLPNIKIGKNSIIGAGAVVTKDIESGVTVIGNPARLIQDK